jgi:RNA-directed DNA polymerase
MKSEKPYSISKKVVLEAFKLVKANRGAAGVDEQTIKDFEQDLKGNLYKIWNRMSSGSYFPPPVKAVPIPKKTGGVRILGIPTVSDRIAQMVVKLYLEPKVEPIFHEDSYGYRPGKSAKEALSKTRVRCWKYGWVLEYDIKGYFDNIDHQLLMKVVERHTKQQWIMMYIKRWIETPFQDETGTLLPRERGTMQGGVISPLLANMFLHYVFDIWMGKHYPNSPFARYADDAVIHCHTENEAREIKISLEERFRQCKLEINQEKTKIIYCKNTNRKGDYSEVKFDFLGYTFRPRKALNRKMKVCFLNFELAASQKSLKAMRQQIRIWKLHHRTNAEIEQLAKLVNPFMRGWINYYTLFNKRETFYSQKHLNDALVKWAQWKYKKFKRSPKKAWDWLREVAKQQPTLFVHWQHGGKLDVAG